MNIQESVLENFKDLTIDKQKAVLEFVKFLRFQQENQTTSNFTFKGLWSNLNFSITEDDIATARQEMWDNLAEEVKL